MNLLNAYLLQVKDFIRLYLSQSQIHWITPRLISKCQLWLKYHSMLILHFSTGRQIFYVGGLISMEFTGTKACVGAVSLLQVSWNQMETCIASCCLWAVAIFVVPQCRILVAVQYMSTELFSTDNLHLLDCTVTWSLFLQTDTDWICWLAADACVT